MIDKLRREIRPYFFSAPVQKVVGHGNRFASRFLYDGEAKARLQAIFASLPAEFSGVLLPHADRYFEACLHGTGVGPKSYYEISRWLSRKGVAVPPKRSEPRPLAARPKKRQRLKLLFVSGGAPSPFHGGGLMLADMLEMLAVRHDVSLYCFQDAASDGPWDPAALTALKSVKVCTEPAVFEAQLGPWLNEKFSAPPDAIHCLWPNTARLMPQLRELTPRLVYQYVECVTRSAALGLVAEIEADRPASARSLYHLLSAFESEGQATRVADATIAVVPPDAEFAAEVFGGELGRVIPQCLSETHVWKKLVGDEVPDNRDALFLGFFGHPPNLQSLEWYLREVHPRICRVVPDYRLVVAGRGAETAVKGLIGCTAQVFYRGQFDDVVAEISAARLGVAPLIAGSGIRGKINQYSAVGRPTVTTPIGATGLPYEDGKSIFVADSPGEFAERVIRLLGDRALYDSVRLEARALAETHFRWSAYMKSFEEIYAG